MLSLKSAFGLGSGDNLCILRVSVILVSSERRTKTKGMGEEEGREV